MTITREQIADLAAIVADNRYSSELIGIRIRNTWPELHDALCRAALSTPPPSAPVEKPMHERMVEAERAILADPEIMRAADDWKRAVDERDASTPVVPAVGDDERAVEALTECLALIEDMSRFVGKMALQNYQRFNEAPTKARAAIAAHERAKGEAWQPIESAPRDETAVLVWSNGRVYDAHWSDTWGEDGSWLARWAEIDSYGVTIQNPTHWRPLPQPPHSALDAPPAQNADESGTDAARGKMMAKVVAAAVLPASAFERPAARRDVRATLMDCTRVLLDEIAEPKLKRKDIALTYAMAMVSEGRGVDKPDWPTINAAIIARWSRSDLIAVKTAAWKHCRSPPGGDLT